MTRKKRRSSSGIATIVRALSQQNKGLCKDLHWKTPSYIGEGIHAVVTKITPYNALEILERHAGPRMRNIQGAQTRYAREMEKGLWKLNGEPVVFNRKGTLHDGGNRLHACIKSETPFITVVLFGVSDETTLSTNTGKSRSLAQSANFAGVEGFSNVKSAVLRRMLTGASKAHRDMSHQELMNHYDTYQDGVDWTVSRFHGRLPRIKTGSVMGAIAQARYYVPEEDLNQFCEALTGEYHIDGEPIRSKVIGKLVKYLIMAPEQTGRALTHEVYLKTQRVIQAFVARQDLGSLRKQEFEVYVLPNPDEADDMFDKQSIL